MADGRTRGKEANLPPVSPIRLHDNGSFKKLASSLYTFVQRRTVNTVKVKTSLDITNHHDVKTYGGVEV
jgi:hypothetical protein